MTWRIPDSQLIKADPPGSEAAPSSVSSVKPVLSLKKLFQFSELISRPLTAWRDFLLAVSDTSTVYAFSSEELKSPKPQPRRFLNLSEKIAVKGLASPLLKEIRGVLAFPCGNKIFLWDMAADLLGRKISRACPSCISLKGDLAADLAADGQNYLAALTCDAQKNYRLEVFEFTQISVEPYYVFELGNIADGDGHTASYAAPPPTFTLYCSRRAVYLLICSRHSAYALEESGRLTCFSLASLTSKELPGKFYASYTADNVNHLLTGINEDSSYSGRYTLCRFPDNPGAGSGLQPEFIDNTHHIRMYGRRDDGVWLIGSGISRLEGNKLHPLVAPELIDQISMDSIPISVQGKLNVCLKSCQNGGELYIFEDQFSFYLAESVSETFNFAASLASVGELSLGVSENGALCSLTLT